MPGVKGQIHANVRADTLRGMAWRVMRQRAGQGFTVGDLLVAIPGSDGSNFLKWLPKLRRHGYIRASGKVRWGNSFMTRYVLVREHRTHPVKCERCGQALTAPKCEGSA